MSGVGYNREEKPTTVTVASSEAAARAVGFALEGGKDDGRHEVTVSSSSSIGCPVCRLPRSERRGVDAALALGRGPDLIARRFNCLTRRQIKAKIMCRNGDPLVYETRRRGWITPEGDPVEDKTEMKPHD